MSIFLRMMFWLSIWILTLCMIDIEVSYTDGLKIKLYGWPNALIRLFQKHKG